MQQDNSKQYAIFSFLGGATLWFIQKMVRQNYIKIQKELGKIQKKPVLQTHQLEDVLRKNQEYGKLIEQNDDFLVEGKVQYMDGIPPLNSEDQLKHIIYANRRVYDLNLLINTDNGTSDQQKTFKESQIRTVPTFKLAPTSIQQLDQKNVYVEGFKNAITLPGVLDYSCRKEKIKPYNVQDQIKLIIDQKNKQVEDKLKNQQMTDSQRAEKEQKNPTLNIQTINLGLIFEENSLTIGSPLLVYGRAVFDPISRKMMITSAQFLAKDKKQIISYLNDQIFWSKVFEFFLILGIMGCGYYFIKKVQELIQNKKQGNGK